MDLDKELDNPIVGPENEFTYIYEGYCAEFAYCKLHNIYPNFNVNMVSSKLGTDTGDCRLPNGLTVDVKTTKYIDGRLIVPITKHVNGNLFALMIGEAPRYEFKGYMYQKDLISEDHITDLGYGPTYVASQSELVYDV